MNHVEVRRRLSSPCSTADGRRGASGAARSAVCSHLRLRFLDLVFAEVDLAGVGGGADVVGGEGLGDGDEADGGGVASGPAGGARDAIANAASRARSAAESSTTSWQLCDQRLRRRGVRAVGRELQVRLELGRRLPSACLRSRAPCRADSALRRGSGSPRWPSNGFLPRRSCRVPEDDALVEDRVGVAAASRRGAAAPQLGRLRAGRGGVIELALRVVDVGEPVVGLGVSRASPRSPSCSPPRPCRSPSSARS